MVCELVFSVDMTTEKLVDQLADAAWTALTGSSGLGDLYPGYYIPLHEALTDHLEQSLIGSHSWGRITVHRLLCEAGTGDHGLPDDLVGAVTRRLSGLEAARREAVVESMGKAMSDVLAPYVWYDQDGPLPEGKAAQVPGPQARAPVSLTQTHADHDA